jgi:CcmD family protein
MRFLRVLAIVCALFASEAVFARQSQPPRPPPQDEYVPLDQLPPQAELPAAPMVIAAYTFVWVAFLVYMWSLVKRVTRVESDLRDLEQRSKR